MQQLQQLQQAALQQQMAAQQQRNAQGGQGGPSPVSRVPTVTQQAVLAQAQAQQMMIAQQQAQSQGGPSANGNSASNQSSPPNPASSVSDSGNAPTPGPDGASVSPLMALNHGAIQASPPRPANVAMVRQARQQALNSGLGTVPGSDLAGNVSMSPEEMQAAITAHQVRLVRPLVFCTGCILE